MSAQPSDNTLAGPLRSAVDRERALNLAPKSDLTFKLIEGGSFRGIAAPQSMFDGSLLRDCEFEDVDLSRCDFEGVNFQNCVFAKTSFENSNIRSSWLTNCQFQQCDFADAYIEDCTFSSCEIRNNSFERAILNASTLLRCVLTGNSFRKGSFTLDTFRNCSLMNSTLGDCTFLNHLMLECELHEIKINAESIGTCFGITERDLRGFDLIYLGRDVYKAGEFPNIVEALEQEYVKRRWFLPLALFRLNFARQPVLEALRNARDALLLPLTHDGPVRRDDAAFFRMILRELAQQERLPVLSCVEIVDKISDTTTERKVQQNSLEHLRGVAADCKDLLQVMLARFEQESLHELRILHEDVSCTARITFDFEPSVDVAELMNLSATHSGLAIAHSTSIESTKTGSFIATIATTVFTVAAFQMVLFLVNGCVFQITELRARVETLLSPALPKRMKQRALAQPREMPKWMATPLQTLVMSFLKGGLPLDLVGKGYSRKNVRSIEIIAPPRA
jgi:uncharacterized protein YjbI with pentapeptide repeats